MLIVGFCSGFISELSASVKTNSNDELLIEDFFFKYANTVSFIMP